MAFYGQHRYFDTSKLNARYDHAFMPPGWPNPPLMGLGEYFAAGSLKAGSLKGNSLGISGLGAIDNLPWREYSAETEAYQKQLNAELAKRGYLPITADGTLGPATCGAAQAMPPMAVPGTCQSFVAPTKAGGGGPVPVVSPQDVVPVRRASMFGGGTNAFVIGGGIALVAIGAAVMLRKKKRAA